MCDVVSAIMVTTALIGGYVQYDSSKKAESYNSAVAKQNKGVAEAQAIDAERLGQLEANERRLATRLKIANQTVGFAAQNVEITGTPLQILGDTRMFGEIDEQRIREGAARKAWGFRMQGYDIEANNRLAKFQAKTDRTGIILSTASKVAGAWGSGMAAKPGAGPGPTRSTFGYQTSVSVPNLSVQRPAGW